MDIELYVHAVFVCSDAGNNDILPSAAAGSGLPEDDGDIEEQSIRCSPTSPQPSPLNQP
ncbi:hypothetical protein [Niabella soli]|uniref:Uncharacterized protein n=1 Tax=Niabella soli DSM 19437 TaxID=929713 RepID=W0F6J8_9BACT|nr:hypothetical protein [Niabella soli]AHF17084.1 hypothetical protein NIASO_01425 [Niabella soli DSM 19437]